MSYVDSAAYSHGRATFWARPHSMVLTWPVLFALLLLLMLAGLIAIAHHCTRRSRASRSRASSALPAQLPGR
jgi:hypothetical protein